MDEVDLLEDPIAQLQIWLDDARSRTAEPGAMTLATADEHGNPSARVVLLRTLDGRGLTFFTNRHSRKGHELRSNPRVAAVFHWWELGRQVRVEGAVEESSVEESRTYWESRPRGSQIAAWASPQSTSLDDRKSLDALVAEVSARFSGGDVPLPDDWGGYRIVPDALEFWTHRDDRLHDRIRYERAPDGWRRRRLAP